MPNNELKSPRKIRDAEKTSWVFDEEKTIRIAIEIPISLHQKLKTTAAINRTTMAEIVRDLITQELK